jgi:hypothetical protein
MREIKSGGKDMMMIMNMTFGSKKTSKAGQYHMHATYRLISQPPFFSFFSFWKNTQIKLIRLHHFGERGRRTRRLPLSVAMADRANAVLAIAAFHRERGRPRRTCKYRQVGNAVPPPTPKAKFYVNYLNAVFILPFVSVLLYFYLLNATVDVTVCLLSCRPRSSASCGR